MFRILTAAALSVGLAHPALAQDDAPFGTEQDAEYAAMLWDVMTELKLAGDGMIHAFPYEGTEPHGMMLATFYSTATVDGHTGDLVVKRNYGPEGVSETEVLTAPMDHLSALTVMFRREEGYDPDNQNWFWVKYLPDGSLDQNPAGQSLAGRVVKGADSGCISCHSSNENYLFTNAVIGQ